MWWVQRPFNSNSIIHIDPVLGTKNAMFIRHQKYQKWAIQEGGILWAGSALWSSAIPAERLSCGTLSREQPSGWRNEYLCSKRGSECCGTVATKMKLILKENSWPQDDSEIR